MNRRHEDTNLKETVEKLKRKYLEKTKQFPSSDDIHSETSDSVQRLLLAHRSNRPSKDLNCSSEALHKLFDALSVHPDHSHEEQSVDSTAVPLQDSQMLFTETDVTLPSSLDDSLDSQETDRDAEGQQAPHLSGSRGSSSFRLAEVYQEMMTVYEQLKGERLSQQQWEKVLQKREKRLKQQKEAFGRLDGLEQMVHTRIVTIEEKHQRELSRLQDLLRDKSKENNRLKSNFDTIKELNENMKIQLNKISEENKKLEVQSKRVQARLENLQRKFEQTTAPRGLQKGSDLSSESSKPNRKEKAASAVGRITEKSNSKTPSQKLLVLLLDWVLDGQMFSSVAGNEAKGVGPCRPPEAQLSERCLKALPLLADQLHHAPSSEPDLLRSLLRLIHEALRYLDNSSQHVALSATLRRIGEEASKLEPQSASLQLKDLDLNVGASGSFRSWPLYRSPCPHTRILSTLIILRTITQADVLALVLDNLRSDLMCEESRGLCVHYGGVTALLSTLRRGHVGPHTPIDILLQLAQQSRYLNPFLEACSCEEFFRTASQLLKNCRLELQSLEKFSILLQKLSSIRKNRHLFELSSLHLQIQELQHKTSPTHTFLCLNLTSILLNLK